MGNLLHLIKHQALDVILSGNKKWSMLFLKFLLLFCFFTFCKALYADPGVSFSDSPLEQENICLRSNVKVQHEDGVTPDLDKSDMICAKVQTYRLLFDSFLKLSNRAQFEILLRDDTSKEDVIPSWSEAVTIDGIIYLPVSLLEDSDFDKILQHEVFHAYIYSLCSNRVASWIEEGLALIMSGQTPAYQLPPASLLPLRTLRNDFQNLETDHAVLAYHTSLAAVRKLLKEYSFSDFGEYFRKISIGYPHERALASVFKVSEKEIEKKIRE
jgi:hypothetical protein